MAWQRPMGRIPGTVYVVHDNRRWTAMWRQEGREICIDSAYGSARAAVGRMEPKKRAEKLLSEKVAEWLRTRL